MSVERRNEGNVQSAEEVSPWRSAVLGLLKRGGIDPALEAISDLDTDLVEEPSRHILCGACGQLVTTDTSRVEIGGHHVHGRINPEGIEFEFGCFGAAFGSNAKILALIVSCPLGVRRSG